MKIAWISPYGDGWAAAYHLREAGHKVVYAPLNGSRNGEGFLPALAPGEDWVQYAKKADVTFVDATPASRRTRRSYEPSELSFELARLRYAGVPIIGPTPTSELLQADPRYFRKILRRFGLRGTPDGRKDGAIGTSQIFLSLGPFGQGSLVIRSDISDTVLPLTSSDPIYHRLSGLQSFLTEIRHTSYINAEFAVVEDDIQIIRILVEPLYPAFFCHLGDLLSTGLLSCYPEAYDGTYQKPPRPLGLAVSLHRLQDQPSGPWDELLDTPGFFGAELHRTNGEKPQIEAHGLVLGALIGGDLEWGELTGKVQAKADALVPGYVQAPNFSDVTTVLDKLVHANLLGARSWI